MRTLTVLPLSPWSEMARWALDHHRLGYKYVPHTPLVGEPLLRWRVRRLVGKVTVPVLVDEGRIVNDSFAIARYAEQKGSGLPLFPAGRDAELLQWGERSDAALHMGRALVLAKLRESPEAQAESVPRAIPRLLRRRAAPMAKLAARFLSMKYDAPTPSEDDPAMVAAFEALRVALSGRETVFDRFSYADITMACALQFVSPVKETYIRLPPASRRTWTCERLATEYADLIRWRDGLYEKYRRW